MISGQFLKTREEIHDWLLRHWIKNYTIRDDLTVDATQNVNINLQSLTHIPVQFGIIEGFFSCIGNQLTSLAGAPIKCREFSCKDNQITSLVGLPRECDEFDCSHNQINSLIGSPVKCRVFDCSLNQLTSLAGAPRECPEFNCSGNRLINLDWAPIECSDFNCSQNRITRLNGVSAACKTLRCFDNPYLYDISAVPDGCVLECDYGLVARNLAARQLAGLASDDPDAHGFKPKSGRTL